MKNQVKNNLEEQDNYTTKYLCEKCKDVTYILEGDKAIPCTCKEIRRGEMMLRKSGISEEFAKKTFHNFDFSRNIQVLNAYTKSIEYTKILIISNHRKNSIILMGSVGGGRLYFSFAIANELMKNGVGVIYMGYRDSIMKIQAKYYESRKL